jgi:hypothetical protein
MIYNGDYYNKAGFAIFTLGEVSGLSPVQYSNTSLIYEPAVMVGISEFAMSASARAAFGITLN